MNDQQIEQLIKQSERRIWWHTWRASLLFWGVTLTTPLTFARAMTPSIALIIGGILCMTSIVGSKNARSFWRAFVKSPTILLWKEAVWGNALIANPSPPTKTLRIALTDFYRTDQSAEVLPLAQGLRLLSVYELQQQRRILIGERITQLHALRDKLLRTATQLESLGESHPDTTISVHKAENELATLERLVGESAAACERLESIVAITQKVLQVRKLQHELTKLQSDITSTISQPLMESQPTNIEDQISREIETYLQLERETEVHFRDL